MGQEAQNRQWDKKIQCQKIKEWAGYFFLKKPSNFDSQVSVIIDSINILNQFYVIFTRASDRGGTIYPDNIVCLVIFNA